MYNSISQSLQIYMLIIRAFIKSFAHENAFLSMNCIQLESKIEIFTKRVLRFIIGICETDCKVESQSSVIPTKQR